MKKLLLIMALIVGFIGFACVNTAEAYTVSGTAGDAGRTGQMYSKGWLDHKIIDYKVKKYVKKNGPTEARTVNTIRTQQKTTLDKRDKEIATEKAKKAKIKESEMPKVKKALAIKECNKKIKYAKKTKRAENNFYYHRLKIVVLNERLFF